MPPRDRLAAVRSFPTDRLGDGDLVAALARGETDAIGTIWDRYCTCVRGVIRAMMGVDVAVDDLVQDVFLALLKSPESIENPGALKAYLLGIAMRLSAQELRRRTRWGRLVTLTLTGQLPERPVRDGKAEVSDVVRALLVVLGQIPERERMAVVLRYVEELSPLEVAIALGISESTAKRAIIRGRERLEVLARHQPVLVDHLRDLARQEEP